MATIGTTFSPSNDQTNPNGQTGPNGPTNQIQDAIRILSFAIPHVVGAQSMAAPGILGRGLGGQFDPAILQNWLRQLLGGGAGPNGIPLPGEPAGPMGPAPGGPHIPLPGGPRVGPPKTGYQIPLPSGLPRLPPENPGAPTPTGAKPGPSVNFIPGGGEPREMPGPTAAPLPPAPLPWEFIPPTENFQV